MITYKDFNQEEVTLDMSTINNIKCDSVSGCKKGELYAIVRLFVTGNVKFNMIVVLEELIIPDYELLCAKIGMKVHFADNIIIGTHIGLESEFYTDSFVESFSISIIVSVFTFLAILLMIV